VETAAPLEINGRPYYILIVWVVVDRKIQHQIFKEYRFEYRYKSYQNQPFEKLTGRATTYKCIIVRRGVIIIKIMSLNNHKIRKQNFNIFPSGLRTYLKQYAQCAQPVLSQNKPVTTAKAVST